MMIYVRVEYDIRPEDRNERNQPLSGENLLIPKSDLRNRQP